MCQGDLGLYYSGDDCNFCNFTEYYFLVEIINYFY